MIIRTLIVDDEPLARERIRTLVSGDAEIQVVGECADGTKAVSAIQKLAPDLLFLDVQMPEMDGFEVLGRIAADRLPVVIFVTAYDRYCLRAFEVHALDYLLKPFDRERFEQALARAKSEVQRSRTGDLKQRLAELLNELKAERRHVDRLVIKSSGRVTFLRVEEVDWLEAEGNYVRLHVGAESHLMRDTMSSLESQLPPRQFVRIHRSAIVNLDRLKELQPFFHGDYVVILKNGKRLPLSRGYRERLEAAVGKPL